MTITLCVLMRCWHEPPFHPSTALRFCPKEAAHVGLSSFRAGDSSGFDQLVGTAELL